MGYWLYTQKIREIPTLHFEDVSHLLGNIFGERILIQDLDYNISNDVVT